jgi:hypothetical protein
VPIHRDSALASSATERWIAFALTHGLLAAGRIVLARPSTSRISLSLALSLHSALAGVPAATLEAGLVIVPQAEPFRRLGRLRSPLWTALLPGSIIVGTFGLIVLPRSASTALLASAVTTPLLALVAVLAVVRARKLLLPIAAAAAGLALLATGRPGQLGAAVVTALACLTIGAALQRLIPPRWLLAGVVAMSAADVALLAFGPGYHQTVVLAAAASTFHGPSFTGARVGGTTIGYPDLFLAALLGTYLAGGRSQRLGALVLGGLVIAYDSLLSPGVLLPATVPIALTLIIVQLSRGSLRPRTLRCLRRGPRGWHRSGDPGPAGAAGG